MKGLFVNLTSVNVSEISEKKTSATYHKKFALCQNLQIKVRCIIIHRYARFKEKSKLFIF